MKAWLTKLLFDWVFVLLYRMLQGFLYLVSFIEKFFDIFAGTAKIFYKGNADFLLNVFFAHDAVTNAFWAMALIAIVLAFAFCIVQMARKATDVTGAVKQTTGQIVSNFFRCLLIILLINVCTVAVINMSNVLLDRINFALQNSTTLMQSEQDRTFSEQEYATMTKILATVGNYSANPSADSRYNINSCFNAIRSDLLSLHVNGFFEFDYPLDDNGHYTWQGALALLASSADLSQDLNLGTYYADVVYAFQTVSKELSTYPDFKPVKSAHFAKPGVLSTDTLIFLIVGMEASNNPMYNTGNFYDALRKGYISGKKSYNDLDQVRKDFDIWEMNYLIGYIACITFVIIISICIFTFIVRIFNLLLLYLTAPLFASSMSMDDGSKWQSWTQAFVIQLFSGFGMVIAMRLYLIIIPIIISSDLVFFAGTGMGTAILNRTAQLLMVLGGAWAVLQAGGVITGILAGNPGMAAIQQEGHIGRMVTGWAMQAPRAAMSSAKKIAGGAMAASKHIAGTAERNRQRQDKAADLSARKAQQRQNAADAKFAKANQMKASGASASKVNRAMNSAQRAQRSADKAIKDANASASAAGRKSPGITSAYQGGGGSFSGGGGSDSGNMAPPPPRDHSGSGTTSSFSGGGASGGNFSAPIARSRDTNDIVSDSIGPEGSIPAGQRADYWRSQVSGGSGAASGGGSISGGGNSSNMAPPPSRVRDSFVGGSTQHSYDTNSVHHVDTSGADFNVPAGQRADYWRSQVSGGGSSGGSGAPAGGSGAPADGNTNSAPPPKTPK